MNTLRNLIILNLTLCLLQPLYAKIKIKLNADGPIFSNVDFYISKVIDESKKVNCIGFNIREWDEYVLNLEFEGGIQSSLQHYFDAIIITDTLSDPQPIVAKIKQVYITEQDNMVIASYKGVLTLEYFSADNKLIYMTHYSSSMTGLYRKQQIEELLKTLINKSIYSFNLFKKQELNAYENLLCKTKLYDSILASDKPKKGFYTNFFEFQANKPSLRYPFNLVSYSNDNVEDLYFNFSDPNINIGLFYDYIIGFSDGDTIFLKKVSEEGDEYFLPINSLGPYVYIGKRTKKEAVPTPLPFGVVFLGSSNDQDYIMSIATGIEHPVDDETVRSILVSDPEILEIYLEQPYNRRKEMGLYWIDTYNERYKKKLKN
jgi:hypothetical protein